MSDNCFHLNFLHGFTLVECIIPDTSHWNSTIQGDSRSHTRSNSILWSLIYRTRDCHMEYQSFQQNSWQDLSKYGLYYSLACCSNIAVNGKLKILGKSLPEMGRFARMRASGTVNTRNGCGSLVRSMHDCWAWPKYCSHLKCPIYRTLVSKGLKFLDQTFSENKTK